MCDDYENPEYDYFDLEFFDDLSEEDQDLLKELDISYSDLVKYEESEEALDDYEVVQRFFEESFYFQDEDDDT